jgi:hypothetical protein
VPVIWRAPAADVTAEPLSCTLTPELKAPPVPPTPWMLMGAAPGPVPVELTTAPSSIWTPTLEPEAPRPPVPIRVMAPAADVTCVPVPATSTP